jgi:hypothetical protein
VAAHATPMDRPGSLGYPHRSYQTQNAAEVLETTPWLPSG